LTTENPANLTAEYRLPTPADAAVRSECKRAARSARLHASPIAAPPKQTEVTPEFSSNRKEIDNSPGRRYSSGQKKSGLKFLYKVAVIIRSQKGGEFNQGRYVPEENRYYESLGPRQTRCEMLPKY
jgi:hypothetical protein